MKTRSTKKSWWNGASNSLLPILIALIFFVFTFSFYPFREKLQYDTDEGLNLMRSMLVEMGHPMYSEVSSDQPPLFNQILALVFLVAGFEVNAARFLVLLFSTLLVWAGAQFLQLTWGNLAAILFLPLIIMTPRYLGLSVSVMIGVPSIALAAASLVFVSFWHPVRAGAGGRYRGRRMTGLPLADEEPTFQQPFLDRSLPVEDVFYCAESVLLPEYRGLGIGHRFFNEREAHARRLGRFRWTAFAAVDRAEDDPRRPPGFRGNETFWRKRGYVREPGMTMHLAWKETGQTCESEKALTFWLRPLEGDA